MSSLCYIFLIWLSCVGSFMADSRIISARVGPTAVLPNKWRNVPVQTPHVQWNTDNEIVFERKGEQLFQGKGNENRVDVPQDKPLKENLAMKNMSVIHAEVYQSYQSVKRIKRAKVSGSQVLENLKKLYNRIQSNKHLNKLVVKLPGDAGANCPRPLIILLSFLTSLCFFYF